MKKILIASLICCVSTAYADSLSFIKQIYQDGRKSEKSVYELLYPRANNELKQALNLMLGYEANTGYICGTDADVVWQSQDPDYNTNLSFSKVQNGVKVKFGYGGAVTYNVSCNGNSCKISDVIGSEGSLRNRIKSQCH